MLVTTHYLDEAERCHRLALIHAGRLAALGTSAEVKQIFAGRPIVEVRAPQAVAVMRALDAMPEVEKTSLFGTSVHAVLRHAAVTPTGYGLGRAGWISVSLPARPSAARWREVEEWVRTSYTLVAPKSLARQVLDDDGASAR